ncbi:MAG TPA: hypothetical protein DDW84_02110 [Phycisphaerales bacterium]|nr:MAG: hypothetical protein A2Y13_09855 [Planctomycetes bacterium GWC2_45_44]HBG77631.1 hypothetical protein [Phycisphaerales bacterium]HBR19313.1 hypothetical protein [Phycisphaerales bacterium]
MWLLNLLFNLFGAFTSVLKVIDYFRRHHNQSESPFVVVPIEELISNLSSPLNVTPELIKRDLQEDATPGIHIFLGTSGVGKTREAAEFVNRLSNVSGAKVVYLAKGYINSTVPLPKQKDVKRVIVMIDDYDWGFAQASSDLFIDREAARLDALVNLRNLYDQLKTQLDLHAFVVTINQHRLPVSSSDINKILPECKLTEMSLVTPEEFSKFTLVAAKSLDVQVADEALNLLVKLCDGRFDSVATFLASFNKGHEIQKTEITKFSDNLKSVWQLFKDKLSDDQKNVYDKIKILKDFKLAPRIEYVTELLQLNCQYLKEKEVRRVIASIWPVTNSKALVYDGQFGPSELTLDLAKQVISAVLKSAHLRYKDRYAFQEETKKFASMLTEIPPTKIHLHMLCKLCKWYPRDRYFAYLLALAYKSHGKYIRGILTIYRILNQRDVREIIFGNWIGIKLHLLLADLYQCVDRKSKRYWKRYKHIEKEFERAASLADPDFPDFSCKDYGELKHLDGTPASDEEKCHLENEHKELGFDIPPALSVDRKSLRAMVHHKYAEYLLGEFHREYDSLKHEEIVTKLLPEYGDAYLTCARAYLKIGNSQRALAFVEQAGLVSPQDMDSVSYDFWVAQMKWASFYDMGDMSNAKKWFNKCDELSQKEPLCQSKALRNNIEEYRRDFDIGGYIEQLALLRQKEFGEKLTYRMPSFNIELFFPGDWKINNEEFSGDFLNVIFAPTATWDETAQCPYDASVHVMYSTLQGKMSGGIEAAGAEMLKSTKKFGKIESTLIEGPKIINEITYSIWEFKFAGSWPKEGFLITFVSPTYRILMHAMYQTCGKHIFKPILTDVIETFTQNLLHTSNWKITDLRFEK